MNDGRKNTRNTNVSGLGSNPKILFLFFILIGVNSNNEAYATGKYTVIA